MSPSPSLCTHSAPFSYLLLIPILSAIISLLPILSSFNYNIVHSLPAGQNCAQVFDVISFGPPGFLCLILRESRSQTTYFMAFPIKGPFLKPCASSQSWSALTIHQMNNKFTSVKFLYFPPSFFFLFFFFLLLLSQTPFMSTGQRFGLPNISLINNTFCFWDQLVGG